MIDNWQSYFKDFLKPKTTDVSKALDARNAIAHPDPKHPEIPAADAVSYLTAIRDIGTAISAKPVVDGVTRSSRTNSRMPPPRWGWAPEMVAKQLAEPAAFSYRAADVVWRAAHLG